MSRDAMLHQVQIRQGAYLPHWTASGATYHVVFRLADSLPVAVVTQYRTEIEALQVAAPKQGQPVDAAAHDLRRLFSERIETILDQGLGSCWLARPAIAELTVDALRHFEGQRYDLRAWCVMPNHVHVIACPLCEHRLPSILKSWKGYVAHEANRLLARTGEFWQPEYYDHLIRSERELADAIVYVQNNPIAAGLSNWPWVWPTAD